MAAKPASATNPRTINHNTDLPPVAQAANIALMIMGATKTNNWRQLIDLPDRTTWVNITDEQQRLLDDHQEILPYVVKKPLSTVYACPVCERYAFIGATAPSKRCTLTLGCHGSPMKASTSGYREPKPAAVEPAADTTA